MEFLKPSDEDPEKVVLVLLVANVGETFILLYRWDTRLPLCRIKPMRCSGQQLPIQDSLPLMLIPSMKPLSFLLVTETELVLYSKVTASRAERKAHPFKIDDDKNAAASSSRSLLWTHWAKPKRHRLYNQTNDDLFLVREDGYLRTYLIEYGRDFRVKMHFHPGGLGFRVDAAFCLLASPLHIGGGDILVAAGDMVDGGVFHLKARQPPERIQVIPTNAPFNDLLVKPPTGPAASSERQATPSSEMYAACGSEASNGCVVQLQFGYEAQIGWAMEFDGSESVQHLWVVENIEDGKLLLLAAHVMHTSATMISVADSDVEHVDSSTWPGLVLDDTTLDVAKVSSSSLIQVTSSSVNVLSLQGGHAISRTPFSSGQALCAVLMLAASVVVTAQQSNEQYTLHVDPVRDTDAQTIDQGESTALDVSARPICMSRSHLGSADLVLVGTEQGHLFVYVLQRDRTLMQVLHLALSDVSEELKETVVASVILLTVPNLNVGILLCGLRNGQMLVFLVEPNDDNMIGCKHLYSHKIGVTSVITSPDHLAAAGANTSAAFVHCESSIKHIRLVQNNTTLDYEILDVITTSQGDPTFALPVCSALYRAPAAMNGVLVVATADEFVFTTLVAQKQAIVRRIKVPGIPTRLMWSTYMKQIVVGFEGLGPSSSPSDAAQDSLSRTTCPMLCFPDTRKSNHTLSVSEGIVVGETKERIRALAEYSPSDGSKHYEFILVALSLDETDEYGARRSTGRVVCISAKYILKGETAQAKARLVLRFPGKAVTALQPIGMSSILIGAGSEIVLHDLNVETKKWSTLARYTLPSPATSIRVQGSLAYVATLKHSLLILRTHQNSVKLECSDSIARVSTNVSTFDGGRALLTAVSDSGTRVIGFEEDRKSSSIREVFQANVPLVVDRIAKDMAHGMNATHTKFVASTIDGTLYQLSTLSSIELRLLLFLQGLCRYEKKPSISSAKAAAARARTRGATASPPSDPGSTHCDGDVLATLLDFGPTSLDNVVSAHVKQENGSRDHQDVKGRLEALRELTEPVLGHHNDVVGATMLWLRRMLQQPVS